MSTVIDQRVAELRFDNSHFEKNVSTTMSTLDKLKEKLNLTGASKGLSDIGTAAKKIDMSGLASGVETVRARFSALEVMGVTALANITNSAVNAGKRIVKSLTIDPVTTGWNEYELKMNSVQTIMASTGASIETVNKYLNELNEYSDKTIYSFSDMTQNIGKFTNAGVALEDAVLAMKGISNEAALSGANANEAARAMYNLSQAMSMGYVQYIDWKSIENANMATVSFKEELLKTAVALGAVTDAGDGMYTTLEGKTYNMMQMFKDGMKDQWLTSEVLIETLKDYADETTEIGAKAYEAATKVKTFSHMLDTLKEAAQSGWAQTWEIIFGDFEEGTTLWTGINKVLGGIIDKMSDVRNALAKNVFYSNWEKLTDKIEKAGVSVEDFQESIKTVAKENGIAIDDLIEEYGSLAKAITKGKVPANIISKALKRLVGIEEDTAEATEAMTDSLTDYEKIADQVINGVFGDGEIRVKKLTDAGYDWAYVQNIVNERLGSSVRHVTTLTEEQIKQADSLAKLNDETLKSKGYTDEQITALRDLQKAAEDSGSSINELINDLERPSGRELVIDAFSNAFEYFGQVVKTVGEAWNEVFGDIDFGQIIYEAIAGIKEFTDSLEFSEEKAENFKNVCEGAFSVFKLSGSIFSMSVLSGLKILNAVLEACGTNMLKVAGSIGKWITETVDWIDTNTIFMNGVDKIANVLVKVVQGLDNCFQALWNLKRVSGVIEKIKNMFLDIFNLDVGFDGTFVDAIANSVETLFTNIEQWIKGIDSAEDLGRYIIEGLYNGLKWGIEKLASIMHIIAQTIINVFKGDIDSHSPSKVFYALGTFIILGLINGIANGEGSVVEIVKGLASSIITAFEDVAKNGIPYIVTMFKTLAGKLLEFVGDLDLGTVIATGMGVGMLVTVNKLVKVAEKFVNPLVGLNKLFGSLTDTVNIFKETLEYKLKAKKIETVTNLITTMAIAIAALAASLWIVAQIPAEDIERAGFAIAQLAIVVGMLGLVAVGLEKLGGFSFKSMSIIGFAATILILAVALKKMSTITDLTGVVDDMLTLLAGLLVAFGLMAALTTKDMGANLAKAGTMFLGLSVAMLILSSAMKRMADLEGEDITKGMIVIGLLQLFFLELVAVAKTCGAATSQAGGMLFKMSLAILMIVGVIKLIGMLDYADIAKALPVITLLELMFIKMIAVSTFAGQHAGKAGIMMIGIGVALLAAAMCIEKIGKLDVGTIVKGIVAVGLLGVFFEGLIRVSKYSGEHAAKAGAMLLMVSGALLMLTGVIFILGKLPTNELWKAVGVIAVLEALFGGLIFVTKYAQDCKGTLITLMVAIGLLTGVLLLLSYIPIESLKPAVIALTSVVGVFAALMLVTKFLDESDGKWKSKLIMLGALTGIVFALGSIVAAIANKIENPESAVKTAEALGVLMLALSGVLLILTKMPPVDKSIWKTYVALGALGLIVAEMGYILGILNQNGLNSSINDVVALSIMLGVMSGVLLMLDKGFKGGNDIYSALFALAGLGLVVGEIGVILGLLNKHDMNASLGDVAALSLMLAAMSGVLIILDGGFKNPGNVAGSIMALAGLGLVVVEVGVILGLMSKYDMHASLGDVAALSLILIAMTGVLVILGATSGLTDKAWLGIGALAALGIVVGAMGLILGELKKHDMMASVEDVKALSIMLLAMSAALTVLGVVGMMAGFALAGIGVLVVFIGVMAGLLEGFGKLYQNESARQILADGGKFLKTIGTAIGEFFGSIVSGFTNEVITSVSETIAKLPDIGTNLSKFMDNLSGFIEGAKQLSNDTGVLDGVTNLVEIISKISSMGVWDKVTSIFGGGSASLDTFATNLNKFGGAMVDFSNQLVEGNFQGGRVKAASAAAEMIATLYEKLPKTGGLLSSIFGTEDLGLFSTQLVSFGSAIVAFSQQVSGDNKVDDKAVKAAVKSGELIAKLQDSLPETGGIIEKVTGMKDLSLFGTNLVSFGTAIVAFSKAVSVDGAINQDAVKAAKVAGDTMVALQDSLPACEGVFQFFGGKQDLATFGANIDAFGDAIVSFSSKVAAEGAVNQEAITVAKKMGILMTEVQAAIPEDKWFDGKMSLDDFGKKLEKFGGSIATYSEKVAEIDNGKISASTTAADNLVKIAQNAANIDQDNIDNFSKIKTIGTTIKEYAEKVADIDSGVVSTSISAINKLINAIGNMAGLDTSGVASFKDAINSLGETNIDSVVKVFEGSKETFSNIGTNLISNIAKGIQSGQASLHTSVSGVINAVYKVALLKVQTFRQAGSNLISKFASGITNSRLRATTAMSSVLLTTISVTKGYYWSFYNAGTYLVDGFAAGITARTWKAEARAEAMADAAYEAAKEALDVNSPSKVFRALGYSVPEGLAMGIDRMSYMSSDSVNNMVNTAIGGVKKAISRISDYMNEDIDSQPTIRPVVDLSDVKTGIKAINGIFGQSPAIGVSSNIRSINSMMNQRNQNGVNTDVVSAIDKLRKDMGNIGNTTNYSINGVNIGNENGVAEAFETIVRAMRIEGRA